MGVLLILTLMSYYDLKEKAYGEVVSPTRSDIKEYYCVDGEITSNSVRFVKIPECNYDEIRWFVEPENEVSVGEKLGVCGKVSIYSSCDGVIKEINTVGEEPYIKVQTFDSLLFKTIVPLEIESKLKEVMYDKDGNKFNLEKKSRQYSEQGVAVLYKLEDATNYRYGQILKAFSLYTGEVFSGVLVLPKSCVYKGYDDKMYVRLCDDAGYYIREQEVNTGFEMNGFVSVVGITEKEKCDAGYSYAKNNEDIPNDIELAIPSQEEE